MNFENFICGDYAIVICKFLDPVDILTLYEMFPKILPKIKYAFARRVGETIDEFFKDSFGVNYMQFRKAMISSNAVLSGSFILQAILNERWYKDQIKNILSDVDIFILVNKDKIKNWNGWKRTKEVTFCYDNYQLGYTELHKFLYKKQVRNERMEENQRKYFLKYGHISNMYRPSNFVTHSFYNNDFGENVVLRINKYPIKKYKFEVVEIDKEKYSTFEEFMEDTVDFDVCKNFFRYTDGDNFEIKISNLQHIVDKKLHIIRKRSPERLEKYINRGFSTEI